MVNQCEELRQNGLKFVLVGGGYRFASCSQISKHVNNINKFVLIRIR